jgi:hypothetical protein
VCPIENEPGTWQVAVAAWRATSNMTTLALHSEGEWTAYFDSISIDPLFKAAEFTYLGCFVDNTNGVRDVRDDDEHDVGCDASIFNCNSWGT